MLVSSAVVYINAINVFHFNYFHTVYSKYQVLCKSRSYALFMKLVKFLKHT